MSAFLKTIRNIISDENLKQFIDDYANHPSILKIQGNVNNVRKFIFKDKSPLDFEIEILKLNSKKAHDIISTYLSRFYNEAKQENKFPKSLKMADVLPIHKKDEKTFVQSASFQ